MSDTLQRIRLSQPERLAPSARAAGAERASRGRDPWLDNAKMLLVTLVVVGHMWILLPESATKHWFYDFLYLWHVPAFVMVTGYLSRSFTWSRPHLTKLVTTVAVPYVVFEGLLAAFRVYVGGEELDLLFADPHWPMWYLAALLVWRLATPLLRSPRALLGAVVLSLLGGMVTGEVLDLTRTTALLPFFTLGLLARREHLDALRTPAARVAGAAVLVLGFALARFVDGNLRTEWLYWRSGYAEMDTGVVEGMLLRAGLLLVAGVMALAFLSLVPRQGSWFSRLGAATLVVYLFHGFAVKAGEYAGGLGWAQGGLAWVGLVVAAALGVVLAFALAAPPVSRRLNVLVDPVGTLRRR